ncbi:MAG: MerR family transcriptional regulator [Alphaproteobacteria bacterium]|nr:MerR family transcriptional regulator [Alphaproteobacteria bacterium]MBR4806832.1 MerR family transcriptional regulator [Alphaproteobacteria bacterium]
MKRLNQQQIKQKMDKEYFVSINNVSRELGIPAYTLRYWEKQFPTIVHPTTGAGGRRYYRGEMVERLRAIKDLLYNRGMTIAGVKKMIRSGEFSSDEPAPVITPREPKKVAPVKKPEPVQDSIDDIESIFRAGSRAPISSIDTTKIDLAIGLLNQAKEVLQ